VSKIIDYDSTMINFLRLRLISSIVNPIIESVLIKPITAFIHLSIYHLLIYLT